MRFPQKIKAGRVSDAMVINLDFAPTFLDFAGAEIPAEMQGESLRKLTGEKRISDWCNAIYYHYYEYPHGWHDVKRHYGIRTSRYKLIHFYKNIDAWELYDLETDPDELTNLYENRSYGDVVEDLKAKLKKLQQKYGDTEIES